MQTAQPCYTRALRRGECGWGASTLALTSAEGQAAFVARTMSKLALAVDGAMRMRLAWLISLVVCASPGGSRIGTSFACMVVRVGELEVGTSGVRHFASLLRLTSEWLWARVRGFTAECGLFAFALLMLRPLSTKAWSCSHAESVWAMVLACLRAMLGLELEASTAQSVLETSGGTCMFTMGGCRLSEGGAASPLCSEICCSFVSAVSSSGRPKEVPTSGLPRRKREDFEFEAMHADSGSALCVLKAFLRGTSTSLVPSSLVGAGGS